MDNTDKLTWSALEYEERERTTDWFWAFGVIVITSSLTAIIYSNYFFAVLILLSGALLYFFSKKTPELIEYELNHKGLKIKSSLYPYDNIKSFYVQLDETPMLFVKTERLYMPVLSIPIEYTLADDVYAIFMSKKVMEEEMHEHASEKIIRTLGL